MSAPRLAALTLVYALTLASFHPLDLAAGAGTSAAALLALRRFLPPRTMPAREAASRALRFPAFAWAVLGEIVAGTWEVALVVLGVRPLERPGVVAVPLAGRSPTGVAVSALALTLSPGEVLIAVDWEEQAMLIHVLDASDPEALRAHHTRFYERYQRPVFP